MNAIIYDFCCHTFLFNCSSFICLRMDSIKPERKKMQNDVNEIIIKTIHIVGHLNSPVYFHSFARIFFFFELCEIVFFSCIVYELSYHEGVNSMIIYVKRIGWHSIRLWIETSYRFQSGFHANSSIWHTPSIIYAIFSPDRMVCINFHLLMQLKPKKWRQK